MLLYGLVALAAAVLIAVAVLYVLAGLKPAGYQPVVLDTAGRRQTAKRFAEKAMEFNNRAGDPARKEVLWQASDADINRYLASMPEIVEYSGGRASDVHRQLHDAGLSDLAIRTRPGTVTLMFHARKVGKVVSADLDVGMTDDRKLYSRVTGVRVGRLPVSPSLLTDRLARLSGALQRRLARSGDADAGQEVPRLMLRVLASMDAAPVRVEQTINNRRLVLADVQMGDNEITLTFRPADRR